MSDEDIDTSDIPPLDDSFFQNAELWLPEGKVFVPLAVDPDVASWFKAQGADCQRRMNAALRIYAEAHQEKRAG